MSIPRWARAHADALLAAALALVYAAEVLGEHGFAGHRPASLPLALAFSASLAWRRRAPLVTVALGLVIIEFANLAGPNALAETGAFLFGVVIAIYSTGAYAQGRQLVAGALVIVAAIPLAAIEPGQTPSAGDFAFFLMFFGGPFVAGRVMRRRRARERVLEEEGEERAVVAVAEERARIARELHDVIAHTVSVVVLQARGARKLLGDEAAPVREALDTIEHSAGEALTEMRRLLVLLREHDEAPSLSPQPTLRGLGALVDGVRGSGLPVDLRVEGAIDDLPAGVDVSAYRIVQEALTNALKHAGPASASVVIRRSDDELEISVSDDGAGASGGDGSGHGLVGMRERVAVYGGRLEAGRAPGGGYAVRARLMLGPTP